MYLDNIIVYSNMLEEHVEYVMTIINILKCKKLYLSKNKLRILCKEMKILGWIIDDNGIQMNLDKVDMVVNWKVSTNCNLLRGFIGLARYLADDIYKV